MSTPVPQSAQSLLLTSREAAQALRVSTRTLWNLTKRGEVTAVPIGTRGIRYARADLEAWIDRQRTPKQ